MAHFDAFMDNWERLINEGKYAEGLTELENTLSGVPGLPPLEELQTMVRCLLPCPEPRMPPRASLKRPCCKGWPHWRDGVETGMVSERCAPKQTREAKPLLTLTIPQSYEEIALPRYFTNTTVFICADSKVTATIYVAALHCYGQYHRLLGGAVCGVCAAWQRMCLPEVSVFL